MGKKNSRRVASTICSRDARKGGRQIRTEADIIAENEGDGERAAEPERFSIDVAMWEFGQNDPKRDSGSKMVRFGMARKLRVGESFRGIVLSSEAKETLSPADAPILLQNGIAGINCSWNRLEEIPFGMLGRAAHQRKLPLIVAANTVNYGKPFKMNTAEAIAGSLYIAGYKEECRALLEPFSFGPEFLRLNMDALEAYSACSSAADVDAVVAAFMADDAEVQKEKQRRKDLRRNNRGTTSYIDDGDLPPRQVAGDSDDDLMPGYVEADEDDLMPGYVEADEEGDEREGRLVGAMDNLEINGSDTSNQPSKYIEQTEKETEKELLR